MRVIIILIFMISIISCRKIDEPKIENLNGNKIGIIGHGGSGFQTGRKPLPTNSMASINKAIDLQSADGVEVDVQLSKDSVIILYHDEILDGYTSCSGYIADLDAVEVRKCLYREDFAVNNFLAEKIITLEDLLIKYQNSRFKPLIFLDTKYYPASGWSSTDFYKVLAQRIAMLSKRYHAEEYLIAEGYDLGFFMEMKQQAPDVALYLDGNFDESFEFVLNVNLDGMVLKNQEATNEQIAKAHAMGKKIVLFLVKDRKTTVEAINKNPDFIQTDNIDMAHQVLMYGY